MEIWVEHSRQREHQMQKAGGWNELRAKAVKGGPEAGAEGARGVWEGEQSSRRGAGVVGRALSECLP